MKVIYLKPRATWRTELRSDTLWGLVCWGVRYVWGEKQLLQMIAQYESGNPPFLISSAFPYRQKNGERILYLPKPLTRPFQLSEWTPKRMKAYKDFKKIAYVPLTTFLKLINGEITEEEYFLQHEREWKACKELVPKKYTYVHNSVDRLGGETDIYNATLFRSTPHTGLFFFLKILNPDYKPILQSLWPFFEHVGFGGDASIGRGAFQIEEKEIDDITIPGEPKRFITLSLYAPTTDEMTIYSRDPESTWYQLQVRKGRIGGKLYVTNHFLKQPVVMFKEGSSFPLMDKNNYGRLQLVKNVETVPHKVYQYGYAFAVPTT